MNEIIGVIGIIVTFLLGLGSLAAFWSKVRRVLHVVKEILDIPYSVGQVSNLIDKGLEDKTLTNAEVQAIAKAVEDVKVQFNEAKDAINDLRFLGKKVVK